MKIEIIKVVACIIERDGKFLLGQRPENKKHGGLWEFPGGKLEAEESLEDAARRELSEELGVKLLSLETPLISLSDTAFEIYFCRGVISGNPLSLEHKEIKWLSQKDFSNFPFAPLDHKFCQSGLLNSVS